MADAPAPRSKLEEQATAKADLSYSYWAANTVTDAAPPAVPKKLTVEEAAAHHREIEEHKTSTGASAWNQAGTFEERNVTAWAKEKLWELLEGCEASQGGATVCITSLDSCTGEAHQWLVRGKKRGGFELEMQLKWRAELGEGHWVAGTVRVPEVSGDDLDELQLQDLQVSARSEGLAAAEEARAQDVAKQVLQPALEERLRELLEALRLR